MSFEYKSYAEQYNDCVFRSHVQDFFVVKNQIIYANIRTNSFKILDLRQ